MGYTLKCRDMGADCDFVAEGKTEVKPAASAAPAELKGEVNLFAWLPDNQLAVLAEELPRSKLMGLTLSVVAQTNIFPPLLARLGTDEATLIALNHMLSVVIGIAD